MAPTYAGNTPGKVRLAEDSPDVKVFSKKQSGDLLRDKLVEEELELRR